MPAWYHAMVRRAHFRAPLKRCKADLTRIGHFL
jgi:hypothetical protein